MALTDGDNGNGMVMPVQPMGYGYGGGYGGGNWGGFPYAVPVYGGYGGGYNNGFGGDWSWIIILFLFGMFGGGWGGNGFGGWGNENMFPWLMTGQAGINANTNQGFDNAGLNSAIQGVHNAVTSGFGDTALGIAGINQNICQTGNQVTAAVTNGFAQAEIAENSRQMANMNQMFNLSSQLSQCCCDNRLATQQLQAVVQQENCADREALSNGVRDIISAQTAGTQRILDQLCQDKIDAKNERITSLENQVAMQNLAASQAAQTAQLIQDNNAQTAALIQRIAPYPQPSFIVGNPYGYGGYYNNGWNNGCGCGCGNNFGGFNGNF